MDGKKKATRQRPPCRKICGWGIAAVLRDGRTSGHKRRLDFYIVITVTMWCGIEGHGCPSNNTSLVLGNVAIVARDIFRER
ncbi:MAG: hypothetical protein AAF497_18155 [Planctomycetota bacterium]